VTAPRHRPFVVAGRMLGSGIALLPIGAATLALGMVLYHVQEQLSWADSFLNAAMLMGGMGPIDRIQTTAGKWLIGGYALFAGLFFILLAGVMLGPMVHHVLERFHIENKP
jgi:hypothetical protein